MCAWWQTCDKITKDPSSAIIRMQDPGSWVSQITFFFVNITKYLGSSTGNMVTGSRESWFLGQKIAAGSYGSWSKDRKLPLDPVYSRFCTSMLWWSLGRRSGIVCSTYTHFMYLTDHSRRRNVSYCLSYCLFLPVPTLYSEVDSAYSIRGNEKSQITLQKQPIFRLMSPSQGHSNKYLLVI